MESAEIRRRWLRFFEERGHTVVPSASLIADDPTIGETAKGAGWSRQIKIGKTKVRVFFSPEPKDERVSIDTVIASVKGAKSSVIFCMFDPTDPQLITALLATSDRKKLLYGLLNRISDPTAKKNDRSDSGEPPRQPSAATQIKVTLFNRSRKDKKVLAYSFFRPGATPAEFLPELSSVDLSSMSTLPPPKGGRRKAARRRCTSITSSSSSMATPTIPRSIPAPQISATTRRIATTRTCSRSKAIRTWRGFISRNSCVSTSTIGRERCGTWRIADEEGRIAVQRHLRSNEAEMRG